MKPFVFSGKFFKTLGTLCLLAGSQSALSQHGPSSKSTEGFAPRRAEVSKKPCATEKECDATVTLKNGVVVGRVVKRTVDASGAVEEYVRDTTNSKMRVWAPLPKTGGPENDGKMNWADAKAYCASKTDLGLKWRLASEEMYRFAFNPNNPADDKRSFNGNLKDVMNVEVRDEWSSSARTYGAYKGYKFVYDASGGSARSENDEARVRCVSQ